MTKVLNVGVVGAGAMGADHVRTLHASVPAARVVRVFDMDHDRAGHVAGAVGAGVSASAAGLIEDPEVDAVIVASPDFTHAGLVRAAIAAGKPVLCEKPLATSADEALNVVRAEVALGRRLIQVGFMRRFDPGFVELRDLVRSGGLGVVRMVHAVHRNASSSTSTDDAGLVTGSMVHELDTVPWLLDDELIAIRVESPVVEGFRDPQWATLWTRGGAMASVEVFVNAAYGYDVRCEVVGTGGSASLEPTAQVSTRLSGVQGRAVRDDFVAHFAHAYRLELSSWVSSVLASRPVGPSAWDGYLANLAAQAGVRSLASGGIERIEPARRPALYAAPESVRAG